MPIINMIDEKMLMEKLEESIEAKDPKAFLDAINSAVDVKAEKVLSQALMDADDSILSARGHRILTSKEKEYYGKLIEALRSTNPQAALSNLEVTYPSTTIDEIFSDLQENHAVLSHVDLRNVNLKVKILYGKTDHPEAVWGSLTGAITKEVAVEFEEVDVYQLKLTAYLPIPNSMLDLGAEYLDRFIRTILYEAVANGLEKGVISNLVSNTGPIGMMANLDAGTTAAGVTTYTAKTAISVTKWTPEGLAPVFKKMCKTKNGNTRPLNGIFVIVNPATYYDKLAPAICIQNAAGDWVEKHPYPIKDVQSAYVDEGTAVIGMDNRYFMGVGSAEAGNIKFSDDFKFLDDQRTYKIVLYGNGLPKDNNAFQVLNISGLKPASFNVTQVTEG